MKNFTLALTCLLFSLTSCTQVAPTTTQPQPPALIPQPVSLQTQSGAFTLASGLKIIATDNPELTRIATSLQEKLKSSTGLDISLERGNESSSNSILLKLDKSIPNPPAGYRLNVTSSGVTLSASEPAGIFYGIQTLYQLLPKEIMADSKSNIAWTMPAVTIEDHPRFGWRVLMLDVARHFFTVDEVKDFIDNMARYKFNILHLHLADDQGW